MIMIKIKIGPIEKDSQDAHESWINQEINRLRKEGQPLCVRVRIKTDSANVVLTTPDCSEGVGGRPPNSQEKEIIDLWHKRGLSSRDFRGGNLIAFLKQLPDLL